MTPQKVCEWIQRTPAWVSIQTPRQIDKALNLGHGEREAIALACELNAAQLLVDDRAARRVAVERGLRIMGTAGVLVLAAAQELLNLSSALQMLLQTNFRIDPEVIRVALERDASRRKRQ